MAKAAATAETASATELAAVLGLSARRVRELAEAGVLKRRGRGRYDAAEATRDYARHLREVAAGRAAATGGDGGLDLVEQRARLAAAQADRAELELAARRGQLVDAEQVKAGFVNMVTTAKTRLMGVPSKAKARIPTLTVRDIEALEDLITEALIAVAQDQPEAAT